MFQILILSTISFLLTDDFVDMPINTIKNNNLLLKSAHWSKAKVISDDDSGWNNDTSWYPDAAIDINGNIHVVWEDYTKGEWGTDSEIMYANYTSAGWSNATVISDIYGWNDGYSYYPSIATDNNGNIHVVWQDETSGEWGGGFSDPEIMYANYTASGWSNATVISDDYTGWNIDDSWYPRIAVDNNNILHVVWQDSTNGEWGNNNPILYVNYTTSGWSNVTAISDIYGWNTGGSSYPDIAIDKNDNLHIVWQDTTDGEWGTDSEIMYANYTASGWSNATVISDDYTGWNNGSSSQPKIAVDNDTNIHVVWYDSTVGEWGGGNSDPEIRYANYTASGWSNATLISDDSTNWNTDYSFDPNICVDINGIVHIAWYDDTDGVWGNDKEIMYVKSIPTGWSLVTIVSDDETTWNDGDSTMGCVITDKNGKVYVFWADFTDGIWGIDTEIMYTQLISEEDNLIDEIIFILMATIGAGDWFLGLNTPLIYVLLILFIAISIITAYIILYRKHE